MSGFVGRVRHVVAGTAVAALAFSVIPIHALALSYDGEDPYSSGCANTQTTVTGPMNVDYGTVREQYSTSCQTAWTLFLCQQQDDCTNYVIWVHRIQDGLSENYYQTSPTYTPSGYTKVSPMVWDGAGYQADACFQRYFGNPVECNPSVW